jgi:hypothetical protein
VRQHSTLWHLRPWNSTRLGCAILTEGARRRCRLALSKKNNDGNRVRLLNHPIGAILHHGMVRRKPAGQIHVDGKERRWSAFNTRAISFALSFITRPHIRLASIRSSCSSACASVSVCTTAVSGRLTNCAGPCWSSSPLRTTRAPTRFGGLSSGAIDEEAQRRSRVREKTLGERYGERAWLGFRGPTSVPSGVDKRGGSVSRHWYPDRPHDKSCDHGTEPDRVANSAGRACQRRPAQRRGLLLVEH